MLTPSFFIARMASTICSTIFGDRPSEGSSSSTSDGLPIRVRAIVSICCSPPLMRPPGRLRVRPFRLAADFEVFLNRQVGEDAPLLRHVAEPAAHDRMRRLAGDVLAFEDDPPRTILDQADDGTEGGRL